MKNTKEFMNTAVLAPAMGPSCSISHAWGGHSCTATGMAPMFVCVCCLVAALLVWNRVARSNPSLAPLATPSLPVFGNALVYKKDPAAFLLLQAQRLGPAFRVNLAGLETTVLCSAESSRQLANAPESLLSSKAAVADFGFRYTLGDYNVANGADFHKAVVKNNYYTTAQLSSASASLYAFLGESVDSELRQQGSGVIPDFITFVRRVVLSAMVRELLGTMFLSTYALCGGPADFIDDFISLQDGIEDATAQAAVLPLWLALPACLWRAQRRRRAIVNRIETSICKLLNSDKSSSRGVWLAVALQTEGVTPRDAAELIVGLLFAAHKNPAIAAAQTVLYLLETKDETGQTKLLDIAVQEALQFRRNIMKSEPLSVLEALNECRFIDSAVHEALRLTGHAIGAVRKVMSEEGWLVSVDQKTYLVPKGQYVGASHIVPNLDKSKWGDSSLSFDPLRCGVADNYKNDLIFTTFSSGVHKCPGSQIATVVDRLVVALLFSTYTLNFDPEFPVPAVSFERATLAQRAGPCVIAWSSLIESR